MLWIARLVSAALISLAAVAVFSNPASAQEYGPGDQFLVPPTAEAGQTVTVEGNACGPNQVVTFFIDGVQVGQATTGDEPDGPFTAQITIPAGTPAGPVTITAVCPNGEEQTGTLEVVPGTGDPVPAPSPDGEPTELAFTGTDTALPLAQVGLLLVTLGLLAVAFSRRTGPAAASAEDRDHAGA